MGLTPGFWKGRRVLVTGHTGFKGGWLTLWLHSLGANVFGFSLPPPSRPSFFETTSLNELVPHAVGDLRDPAQINAWVAETKPEIVFHLGAQALVRESYHDPVTTLSSNVMGSVHLFEAIRLCPSARTLIVITSDKCYENKELHYAYREDDPLGGRDPYSASKACAELVTAAWRDSFLAPRIAVASARSGNVIGGGDWAKDRLIPDALCAWSDGSTLTIRNPQAIRPWQYHLDALAGYLMLAEHMTLAQTSGTTPNSFSGAWNFAPQDNAELTVEQLLIKLANAWKKNASSESALSETRWQTHRAPQPHEASILRLDSRKAREKLGWHSSFSIERSVEEIVEWHRTWKAAASRKTMRTLSLKQIEAYYAMNSTVQKDHQEQ